MIESDSHAAKVLGFLGGLVVLPIFTQLATAIIIVVVMAAFATRVPLGSLTLVPLIVRYAVAGAVLFVTYMIHRSTAAGYLIALILEFVVGLSIIGFF